jgi:hypothetical protein
VRRSTDDAGRTGDETATQIEATPNLLFLVRDRVAIGGRLEYGRFSSDGETFSSTSIGPVVRLFLAPPGQRVQPFVEAQVLFLSAKSEFDGVGSGNSTNNATQFGAAAGLLFMVTRQVGISSELFVNRTRADGFLPNDPDITTTNVGLRFGVSAFLIR